jgi:exopolysaccharide production protein ExoQ
MLLFAAFAYVVFGWALTFGVSGPEAELDQLSQSNAGNQLVWISLFAAGSGVVLMHVLRGERPVFSAALVFLSAYMVLSLISMSWALAPEISLRRSVQQLMVIFIFCGITMFVREKVRVLNAAFLVLAFAIVLNALLVPALGAGPLGYAGIYAQKNMLAVLSGGLLIVSQSKTSLGLAVLCPLLAIAILTLSRILRAPFLLTTLLIAAIMALLFFIIMESMQLSVQDISLFLFNDTTFTGRTYIWNYVLTFFDLRPWLGWGYQSFWSIGQDAPSLKAENFIAGLNQSHNGYVDVLMETGMIGFAIIVAFLLSLIRAIDRAWAGRADVAIILLSLTLFCSIHNLLESSLTRGFALPWVILLLVAGLSSPARRTATNG